MSLVQHSDDLELDNAWTFSGQDIFDHKSFKYLAVSRSLFNNILTLAQKDDGIDWKVIEQTIEENFRKIDYDNIVIFKFAKDTHWLRSMMTSQGRLNNVYTDTYDFINRYCNGSNKNLSVAKGFKMTEIEAYDMIIKLNRS